MNLRSTNQGLKCDDVILVVVISHDRLKLNHQVSVVKLN